MNTPLITLNTDFGEREPFVASVKGVLCSRCPDARILDLGHQLSAFNVLDGALFAAGAFPHFPPGTIHLIAVAPGPQPRAVAVTINSQVVLCPDNGILTLLNQQFEIEETCALPIDDRPVQDFGHIFFARDILAPAAAAIARGTPLSELGTPIPSLNRIEWPKPRRENGKVEGQIVHIDRFGNYVTNLHQSDLGSTHIDRVQCGDFIVYDISRSYYDVPPGKPLAIFGNSGYLELAYNSDRASDRLDFGVGIYVSVYLKT